MPAARGWLRRAKRLIDEVGPCVEEGYYLVAIVGCDVHNVSELEASAARALELAREFRDAELEVRALGDSGLAVISLGRTEEGLARIDEALTAVLAGDACELNVVGLTCALYARWARQAPGQTAGRLTRNDRELERETPGALSVQAFGPPVCLSILDGRGPADRS